MTEIAQESGRSTHRQNAYLLTFDDTIRFALQSNSNLWSEAEKQLLSDCQASRLSDGARLVLSRLSLRRVKWIKSCSIRHYVVHTNPLFKPGASDDMAAGAEEDGGLGAALEVLKCKNFIEGLTSSTPFETAFEAVQSSFLLDELQRLYKRVTNNKSTTTNTTSSSNNNSSSKNSSSKQSTSNCVGTSSTTAITANKQLSREGLLSAIHKAVSTQRTLFGHPLTHKFAATVLEVMKEFKVVPWQTHNQLQRAASNNNNSSKTNKHQVLLLRINPDILHLLRRCQRLYQVLQLIFIFKV